MIESYYQFRDKSLLHTALTHPSASRNTNNVNSYERMEFLGDSILNFIIADILYNKFTSHTEGELSLMSANLVNSSTLVEIAHSLKIGERMIMDSGEEALGGRHNKNNLENTVEAIIAAIYMDSDLSTVKGVVEKLWKKYFLNSKRLFKKNNKSSLQEFAQKNYKILPKYKLEYIEGPPHEPIFTISLKLKDFPKVIAKGCSKKEAEQKAAKAMLNNIGKI